MRSAIFAVIATVGIATVASGATLNVQSDKATYSVGETITLMVSGDAQGETCKGVYGQLVYSGSGAVSPQNQAQLMIGDNWSCGAIRKGGCPGDPYSQPHNGCATGVIGFSEVFNQIAGFTSQTSGTPSACPDPDNSALIVPPQTTNLSGVLFSVATLTATAPGVVNVGWASDLQWFSTTSATAVGTSFVIVPN